MRLSTQIKKALKAEFPNTEFTVRKRYDEITVTWTRTLDCQEATQDAVTNIAEQFSTRTKITDERDPDPVYSGIKIYCNCEWDEDFFAAAIAEYERYWGKVYNEKDFIAYSDLYKILNDKIVPAPQPTETVEPTEEVEPTETVESTETVEPTEAVELPTKILLSRALVKLKSSYYVHATFSKIDKQQTLTDYETCIEKGQGYTTLVQVAYEGALLQVEWDTLTNNLMERYEELSGLGGVGSFYEPQPPNAKIWELSEEERKKFYDHSFVGNAIRLTCGNKSLIIDPQGGRYIRSVGINIGTPMRNVINADFKRKAIAV